MKRKQPLAFFMFVCVLTTLLAIRTVPLVHAYTTTFSTGSGSNDGHVYGQADTYTVAHDTASSYDNSSAFAILGQKWSGSVLHITTIYRIFLKFDTSSLPASATITSAQLCLTYYYDHSATDFTVNLQKWTGDAPIDTGDYNSFDGTNYDDGSFSTAGWNNPWNNITISNFALITKAGNTLICVRSSRDISETQPSNDEYVGIETHEGAQAPLLVIGYTVPPDTTPPTYTTIGSNETIAGNAVRCYVLWADNVALSGFVFGSNNTGSWINQTWTSTMPSGWGNFSFTLNSTAGAKVQWQEWCNDTSNNNATTGVQTIITGATDSTAPTYTLPSPSTNETKAGYPCLFSCQWTDNVAISIVLFRSNNTGAWTNYTTTGSSGWYNYTLTLNGTPDNKVSYDWWANDTSNNWNSSMTVQTLTTTLYASLNIHTVDVDGNTLTGSTVYMSNGTTIGVPSGLPPGTGYAIVGSSGWFTVITSGGWANFTGITNSTVYVYVKWYGLQVYSLTQLNLTGDTTTSLTCLCYPFTVNTIRFWAASDAAVTSHSYSSNILALGFNSALNNYTLISSCPIIPRYILNDTYNIATCFTSYLSLPHYGNATLTLSYESWGDLYIQATDQTLHSVSTVGGILSVVPSGSNGTISTLSVHCGSLGNPTVTVGFTTGTYGSQIYSGTYVLNGQTLTLSWSSLPSGGIGGTTGTTGPSFSVNIVLAFPSHVSKNQVVNGTLTVTWQSYAMIFIWQVACQQPYSSWVVNLGALPLSLQTAQTQGNMSLPVTLTIPADVADGNLQIPCSVTFQTPTGLAKTVGSTIALTIGAVQPTGTGLSVPYLVMAGFLGLFALFLSTLFVRRSRSKKAQF